MRRRAAPRSAVGAGLDGDEVEPVGWELVLRAEQGADVERVAAAAGRCLQPAADALGACDQLVHLGELAAGQVLELVVRRLPGVACVEERADVVERGSRRASRCR